jgi:hypothetical protein
LCHTLESGSNTWQRIQETASSSFLSVMFG